MRWLQIAAVVLGIYPAAACAAPVSRSESSSVVGRVTSLTFSQVRVARTSCSLTSRTEALAQSFAVGENVAISCARGVLQRIKLEPLKGLRVVPVVGNGGPSAAAGTVTCSSITSAGSASGPITCTTAGSITIGDVTCPINPSGLQIGDVVSISCGYSGIPFTSQLQVPNRS